MKCTFCRGLTKLPDITFDDGFVQFSRTIGCPVCNETGRVKGDSAPRWGIDDPIWLEGGHDKRGMHLRSITKPPPKPEPKPKPKQKRVKSAPKKPAIVLPSDLERGVMQSLAPSQSITGYLCGDPLPGRSALDRRDGI